MVKRRTKAGAVAVALMAGALGGGPSAMGPTGIGGPTAAGPAEQSAPPGASTGTGTAPGGQATGQTGNAPGASGATARKPVPGVSGTSAPDPGDRVSEGPVPAVWPRPQHLRAGKASARITDEVVLVTGTGTGTDERAVKALTALFEEAGARRVTRLSEGDRVPAGPALVVRAGADTGGGGPLGGRGEGAALDGVLRKLGAPARGDLPAGGYRLAVGRADGRDTVALAGSGADGLFHAVQTLRQLVDGRRIAGAAVRDWPGTAVRGMTEGFYGTPWTHEQRLDQLDFLSRTKQNRYLYAPGDDLYRQARWREPYPAAQRAQFRELAERARDGHVTLGWAVAPGQGMCLSSDADVRALTRKLDAMWALGFRAFQLQFQDISYSEWHCRADAEVFGSGPQAAARAHARVASAVAAHLAARHPDAAPLSVMPTEFYQDGETPYRRALAAGLDDSASVGAPVEVAWTGVGVVPRTITGPELARARSAFGRPVVTMDNYPVNDFARDRVFLGPYLGREPAVAGGSAALLGNAMQQPVASRIPLFTAADFAWNPRAYRPGDSWRAAIDAVAEATANGNAERTRAAVTALAAHDASSVLGAEESAYLRPLVDAFWASRLPGGKDREGAEQRLRDAFVQLTRVPDDLAGTELYGETKPWADQLARYGAAGVAALDQLAAQERTDGPAAWEHARDLDLRLRELKAAGVTVGEGVLEPFLKRARVAFDTWSGAASEPDPTGTGDGRTLTFARSRPVLAVTALTEPGTVGTVEALVPGGGWRRLGALSADGWTELSTSGLTARSIRISGPEPSRVRHLVPWYADTPAAAFALARTEADTAIGGGAQKVTVRLTAQRPGAVRGKVTVKAPEGIRVRVPKQVLVPRGTRLDVPLTLTVPEDTPSGTYDVPVTFGGETRVLTVRAFPETGGPDLARGARAGSSADETPDFPAAAAVDGDPATRWSSPVEDGSWWSVELDRPVRLGEVVLRWEAHAARYRVQVSSDGRAWRTVATVADGRGGRESVRMDARDVRHVRVQGDRRATRFGYSLWSVEAYAVKR
ncbi:beta-N-acetylglucosaminidase domain-containing protein [Streptomyces sp. NPDC005955]|uniref:beta-N-acetylglucosaminidase domain-containing protein n=1 Tax=Streptomyces sp. NPDC005955 TaxID=3364738 RepID=UPI0036AD70F5